MWKIKLKRTFIIVVVVVLSVKSFGQDAKIHALFIYNFTKHIEWPEAALENNLVVGVFGSKEAFTVISESLKNKQLGAKGIDVVHVRDASQVSMCNLLYVKGVNTSTFSGIYSKVKSKPVLIVTDKPGMIEKGADINFFVANGKMSFEISRKNIEEQSLAVTASLVNLGVSK